MGRSVLQSQPGHQALDGYGEPISRSLEYRKVMKPLLERKRRARINKCLDELKELMMSVLVDDGENSSKLEKADILEVTVNYLNKLKSSDSLVLTPSVTYSHRFRNGFSACASEVSRFLSTPGLGVDRRAVDHVLSQMSNSVRIVDNLPPNVISVVGEQSRLLNLERVNQHQSFSLQTKPSKDIENRPLDLSRSQASDSSWRPW